MDVTFHDDAAGFLQAAGAVLAADPVRCSVLASTAERCARTGLPPGPFWFAVVEDGGTIAGTAMRTHPAPPHSGFVPAMPTAAATALADALDARDEIVPAWKGDLETARLMCERAARRTGGRPVVDVHTRIFEARSVTPPPVPAGNLRLATDGDAELVEAWCRAFHHDSEVQAGRDPLPSPDGVDAASVHSGVRDGVYHLWEVAGTPVHLSGIRPPAFGVARIGPVYTPVEHRGRGYAGHVVATLSRQALDAGHRVCLYTDQANPVSNALYVRMGYEAVGDEAELSVR